PEEVPTAAGQARVCHIAPMPITVQSQLVEYLAPQPALVSLDPHDEYIVGAEATYTDLLGVVEIFLPSRQEAALLYGGDDPLRAARAFRAAGPRAVAIKLGVEGSLVFGADFDDPRHVPAVPVETVDPTGAGDTFCGAFSVVYGLTGDPIEAAIHAT